MSTNNYDNNIDLTISKGEISLEDLDAADNLLEQETSEIQASAMAIAAASDPVEVPEFPPPFNVENSREEQVGLNIGNLSLTITDFVLPGKNGFDLKLTRNYNSSMSNWEKYSGSGRDKNDHLLDTYGLGRGWGFGSPSVEGSLQTGSSGKVHLGNGRVFNKNDLDGYTRLKDMYIEYNQGYALRYKDGKKVKFSGGPVSTMTDRFGNTITFNFPKNVATAAGTIDAFGRRIIGSITDTLNRKILLSRDDTPNGYILTWILPDNSAIKYTIECSQHGSWKEYLLTQVEDREGRITKYDYELKNDSSIRYSSLCIVPAKVDTN